MAENKTQILSNLICDFVRKTISGQESGIYRSLYILPSNRDMIKGEGMNHFILSFLVEYFNKAYVALITKNDSYFVEKFGEMHNVNGHSYICLLNIVFISTTNFIKAVDRSKYDITDYDNYMKSVHLELDKYLNNAKNILNQSTLHECNGEDISTCDPNKPMFYIKNN